MTTKFDIIKLRSQAAMGIVEAMYTLACESYYHSTKGASKDSEIPNQLYNYYRNLCCCTIFSFIGSHPQDIKAINQFLVMACKENILRYGQFEYGNQYAVEKYYLFPERYVG